MSKQMANGDFLRERPVGEESGQPVIQAQAPCFNHLERRGDHFGDGRDLVSDSGRAPLPEGIEMLPNIIERRTAGWQEDTSGWIVREQAVTAGQSHAIQIRQRRGVPVTLNPSGRTGVGRRTPARDTTRCHSSCWPFAVARPPPLVHRRAGGCARFTLTHF